MNPSARFEKLVLESGLTFAEIAAKTGINLAWVRDLTSYDDEWESNLTLGQLRRLGDAFSVSPIWLLDGSPEPRIKHSDHWLQEQIDQHLSRNSCSLSSIEDRIGFTLKHDNGEWIKVEDYSWECLKSVSEFLNFDWRALV